MAQNLDIQLSQSSNINFNPGFSIAGLNQPPSYSNNSLGPPTQRLRTLSTPMPPPILSSSPPSLPIPSPYSPQKAPSPPSSAPSLTAPLPTIPLLQSAVQNIQSPAFDPASKIIWARDVLFLVDKQSGNTSSSSTDTPVGPAVIHDPALARLVQIAVPLVLNTAASCQGGSQILGYAAEALYLRATFESSGAYPEHIKQNPRSAFRDFEAAARGGYSAAWFRLGRDYENFNDATHARDCFERGVKLGVESCAYVSAPSLLLVLSH